MGATARSAASHVFACVRADSRRQKVQATAVGGTQDEAPPRVHAGNTHADILSYAEKYPLKRSAAAGALVKPYA